MQEKRFGLEFTKNKEIVFDLRRNQKEVEPVVINGVDIEIVTEANT